MDNAQYWFQEGASGGYQIERSLRFNSADSAYLNRTPASAGSQTTWTWSAWIKRAALSGTTYRLFGTGDNNSATNQTSINLSSDSLDFYNVNGGNKTTTAKFRDPSAWYHVVVVWDSNNATASDRIRLYVNGVRLTSFSASTDPSGGTNTVVNSVVSHTIGTLPTNSGNYFDGYLTEIHFIDGQALTPSSFGEINPVTGVWKPKKYTGTYGTNGFYLNFADNSDTTSTTLGKDGSGNGNNWTPNNFSVTAGSGNDSMIDTPTPYADGGNGRGNYCTANPLNSNASTLRNGNLEFIGNAGASGYVQGIIGTIGVGTGKWYFEVAPDSGGTFFIGVAPSNGVGVGSVDLEYINGAYSYRSNGDKCQGTGGTGTFTAYGPSYTSPDVIGVALDLDNGAIYFAKNNTWQNSGVPTSGSSKTGAAFTSFSGSYTPMACGFNGATATLNFGQRPFAYTPPAGFLALNTQNLPEPTIKKPGSYMDVVTYTGNGSTQTIGGLEFSPDFVWAKNRAIDSSHGIYDAVRGATATLTSHSTSAEFTRSGLTAFTSTGFSVGSDPDLNGNGNGIVAWCWDESATPGFDIVTFNAQATAATVAHSLGVAPKFIIMKDRDTAAFPWLIYHSDVGIQKYLQFSAVSSTTASTAFSTAPTSTVFDPGTGVVTGNGYNRLVAYLWSEVAGFSKFGSYTGNGSADGPFVYCGFRPRWVMIKGSSLDSHWYTFDAARNESNVTSSYLYPNLSHAEYAEPCLDFTSNGFKWRSYSAAFNASGHTYIFAAFAETPAKYSLAR